MRRYNNKLKVLPPPLIQVSLRGLLGISPPPSSIHMPLVLYFQGANELYLIHSNSFARNFPETVLSFFPSTLFQWAWFTPLQIRNFDLKSAHACQPVSWPKYKHLAFTALTGKFFYKQINYHPFHQIMLTKIVFGIDHNFLATLNVKRETFNILRISVCKDKQESKREK